MAKILKSPKTTQKNITDINALPPLEHALYDKCSILTAQQWETLIVTENINKVNVHGDNMLILFLRHNVANLNIKKPQRVMLINIFNKNKSDLFLNNCLNFLTTNPKIYIQEIWEHIEDKNWFVKYIEQHNQHGKYTKLLNTNIIGIAFTKTKLEEAISEIPNKTSKITKI